LKIQTQHQKEEIPEAEEKVIEEIEKTLDPKIEALKAKASKIKMANHLKVPLQESAAPNLKQKSPDYSGIFYVSTKNKKTSNY